MDIHPVITEAMAKVVTPATQEEKKTPAADKSHAPPPLASHDHHARPSLADMARAATDRERRMSIRHAVRRYRPAIAWSVLLSACIVMEGYADVLISNFFSLPQFNRKYGEPLPGTDPADPANWELPPRWQSGITNAASCAELLGLLLGGALAERVGYRVTAVGSLLFLTMWIALLFTAQTPGALVAGQVLCGLPWGVFQALTLTYAAEVAPMALRAYLTTYINACWGMGHLIGVGVVRAMLHRADAWAYRVPFALQWLWPVPLAVGLCYMPESPWWLVRVGYPEEARAALARLTVVDDDDDDDDDDLVETTLAMIVHTLALEETLDPAPPSYRACFHPRNRRRTEIVAAVWAIQNLSGDSFSSYSTYFLTQAGLSSEHALGFTLGQYAFNVVGVAAAWALMGVGNVGRRTLYLWGLVGLFLVLFVLGFLGLVPDAHRARASLATGSLLVCWALVYQLTIGTVCFSLAAELSSRRLLFQTMALGRGLYLVVGILCNVVTPYMVSTSAWNWGNFSSFFWAATCFGCIAYTWCRVPEPAHRPFAEIDLLFHRGVRSRAFPTTAVDVFTHPVNAEMEMEFEERRQGV